MGQDVDKRAAALAAVDEVCDGMRVGLGTGSTAAFAIAELGRRCAAGLRIGAIATSQASAEMARAAGIPLLPEGSVTTLDLAIDGADEIDPALRAIKGAGGAMLREKIVATAATRMIAIVDASKQVERLGRAALPVEVLPFALGFVMARIETLGGVPQLRVAGDAPYATDQGNRILDCRFGPLADPAALAAGLATIPGVLGHGLFLDEIDVAYVAKEGAVTRIERPVAD